MNSQKPASHPHASIGLKLCTNTPLGSRPRLKTTDLVEGLCMNYKPKSLKSCCPTNGKV